VVLIFGGFGLSVPVKALAQEAICPCCGEVCSRQNGDIIKEWEATRKEQRHEGRIRVFIHYWECPHCGERFRTATRIWPKDKERPEKKAKASAPSTGKLKLEKIRQKMQQRQGPKR
jgi:transcription initiation factor TFIIIB Brf1 subunit/transcription initiation factor TFIIB